MNNKDKKIIDPLIPNQQLYHDICWYFYTYISQILCAMDKSNFYKGEINLRDDANGDRLKEDQAKHGNAFSLWQWLIDNNYKKDVYFDQYKHIVSGLVSDFLSFISSSLRCIEKNQLAPAISLLRKPLTDNLAYLEILIENPIQILDAFQKAEFREIDNGRKKDDFHNTISGVIRKITDLQEKLETPFIIYNGEAIWNMRYYRDNHLSKFQKEEYNKTGHSSIATLWEHATHLYTGHYQQKRQEDIRTCSMNINMVFDVNFEGYRKFCLRQIYSTLPILLYHTANIVDYLYAIPQIAQSDLNCDKSYSSEQWSNYIAIQTWIKHVSKEEDDMLWIDIEEENTFLCKKCNGEFEYYNYNKKELKNLFYGRCYKFKPIALCPKCNNWIRRLI